jgi:hypothetical protein
LQFQRGNFGDFLNFAIISKNYVQWLFYHTHKVQTKLNQIIMHLKFSKTDSLHKLIVGLWLARLYIIMYTIITKMILANAICLDYTHKIICLCFSFSRATQPAPKRFNQQQHFHSYFPAICLLSFLLLHFEERRS